MCPALAPTLSDGQPTGWLPQDPGSHPGRVACGGWPGRLACGWLVGRQQLIAHLQQLNTTSGGIGGHRPRQGPGAHNTLPSPWAPTERLSCSSTQAQALLCHDAGLCQRYGVSTQRHIPTQPSSVAAWFGGRRAGLLSTQGNQDPVYILCMSVHMPLALLDARHRNPPCRAALTATAGQPGQGSLAASQQASWGTLPRALGDAPMIAVGYSSFRWNVVAFNVPVAFVASGPRP